MARPVVSAMFSRQKMSNEERERRIEIEKKLRGKSDKLKPSSYMTEEAKKIFRFLVEETREAQLFGNLDIFILEHFSDTFANYIELTKMSQVEIDSDKKNRIERMKKRCADQLPRLYNELGLTPSTRAKIRNLNIVKQEAENDPLLQLFKKYHELDKQRKV